MRTLVILIAVCLIQGSLAWADDEMPVVPATFLGDPCDKGSEFRAIELESDGIDSGWWALLTRPEVTPLFCDEESVVAIDVSPDGRFAIAGYLDGMIRVWDLVRSEEIVEHHMHSSHVVSVEFLPDGDRVISGGADGQTILWHAFSGAVIQSRPSHHESAAVVSPTGQHVLIVTPKSDLCLLNSDLAEIRCLEGPRALTVAFALNGSSFSAFCEDDRLMTWEIATGKVLSDLPLPDFAWAVAPLVDGRHVVIARDMAEVSVIDLVTGNVLQRLDTASADWVDDILATPDGKIVVGVTDLGFVIWRPRW